MLKKTFFTISQCFITSYLFCSTDVEDDPFTVKVLRHVELIDDEASEYGIKIVKCSDRLMAKKYGFRNPPGVTYFRKGKYINYDGKTNLLILRALEKGFIWYFFTFWKHFKCTVQLQVLQTNLNSFKKGTCDSFKTAEIVPIYKKMQQVVLSKG